MTDGEVQPGEIESGNVQPPGQLEPAVFDVYRSLVRLLIGLALVGGDDLITRLREWEVAYPPEPIDLPGGTGSGPARDLARRALVGMVFEAAETVRRVAWGAAGLSLSFAGSLWSAFRPVASSLLFRPFWVPVRAVVRRGETRLERWTRTGRVEEPRSRKLAGGVTGLLTEDVVGYAGQNPGVKALIDAQVERLLPVLVADATLQVLLREQLGTWIGYLADRPESLDPLVREAGDRYIAYLNEHPSDVQNLVQGQAVGMAAEVRDNVRTLTVTGDTFLETLARGILRRTPRRDLPPPPPQVRRQAEIGPLADDLRRPEGGAE